MSKVSLEEGAHVWHRQHGIGKIALVSGAEILVEFESGKDEIFATAAKSSLNLLQVDGFWLRKKNDPSAFYAIIDENPIEALVALVRDGADEMTIPELKQASVPGLMSEELWEGWIKKAVVAVKKDPRFEVLKDEKFVYQGDLVQIAGDLMSGFRKAPSLKEKERVCREVLKLEEKGVPVDEVKEAAISFFYGTAASGMNKMGARLEALIFLGELDPGQCDALQKSLYEEIETMDLESASTAVAETLDNSIRIKLMEIIRERRQQDFIKVATQLCKRFKKLQRDWALDYLLEQEDKVPITTILETTMADIATNLQPFVWLAKKTISDPEKVSAVGQIPAVVIPAMFKMFSNIYVTSAFSVRPSDDRSVSREEDELLKLLVDHKKILSFLKNQNEDMIRSFASLYRDCTAIPNEIREDFIKKKFTEKFPGIDLGAARIYGKDEEVIMISRVTFDKYQQEYTAIIEKDLPEATTAIKTAREWGDISENAELTVAQENQRKILVRKSELEFMLENCKIID